MTKYFLILLFLFIASNNIFATEGNVSDALIDSGFYLSTNIIAPFSSINFSDNLDSLYSYTVYKITMGIISNFEYGLSLNFGVIPTKSHLIESRFSTGAIDETFYSTQFHIGYSYSFMNFFKQRNNKDTLAMGLYAGIFVKFLDIYNKLTNVHFGHIVPYITIGYQFDVIENVFIDIRAVQSFAIISFSNLDHSNSGTDFFFSHIPEMVDYHPCISIDIGYRFDF